MLLLRLSLLLLAVGAVAAPPPSVEKLISEAEKAWAKAVVARDELALNRLYGDKLIYAHSSGVTESKSVFVGRVMSGAQRYDVLSHEKIEVVSYGDSAVMHGIVKVSGVAEGKPFGGRLMILHFWHRTNGQWQMVAHQSLKLPHD